MKRILVLCDFSSAAHEAFKFAVAIALQGKGKVHVLYVIDITFLNGSSTLSQSYAFNLNFLKEVEQDADAKFRSIWEREAPITLPVTFKYQLGSMVPEIKKSIAEHEIDLVVMGTQGERKNGLGSNVSKVIQHSTVPVFAIRRKPEQIRNIVVPVLPDQPDKHFYDELKKLQSFFGATLHFLWVNTPLIFRSDREAQDELVKFARGNRFEKYTLHVRSDYDAEGGIYRFSREIGGDLIAMRTHAWKGLAHFLTGSVAEDIANHVDLPVWTCAAQ